MQARAALQAAKQVKNDLTDPNLRVATSLGKQLAAEYDVVIQPAELPKSRAVFAALDPDAKYRAQREEDERLFREDGWILDASEAKTK